MIINGCGTVLPTPFMSHMRPRPGTTHRFPFAPPLDPLMVPQHVGDHPRPGDSGRAAQPASATLRTNFDWLRTPPPPTLTPFQKFVRDVDWSATSLGLIEQWPRELKQLVRLMMAESDPCIVYWGPTCAIIYNEAYAPLVGSKHPAMMGQDARHAFPDFWSYFDKIISEQRLTGETVSGEASMLLMERHGFLEETYFDWTLVPVIGDDGDILASYGTPHDLTDHAITMRRTACIQHLTQLVTKTNTLPTLWKATLEGLGDNQKDVPFALLYSVAQPQKSVASSHSGTDDVLCTLEGTIGVGRGHAVAREFLVLGPHADGFARSVFEAVATGETVMLDASHPDLEKLMNGIEWKGYGTPSRHFAVVPVVVDEEVTAFMIIGLNPYRTFDQSYREFLRYVTEVVGPHISKIQLAAEVKSGAEIAREAKLKVEQVESRFHKFAERSVIGLAMAGTDRNVSFGMLPDGFGVLLLTDSQIVYANDAWYKLAGLKPGTWSYSSWLDTVIPEDRPLVEEWWTRVLTEKSGGSFQFRCKEPFRRGHMSSDYRTIMCAVYTDLNEAGEIESVMGLTIDISELKWTEEQLRIRTKEVEESNGKYRNYAEHCPLGIVRTDADGYVQYGNEAWHNFYGFKKGQVTDPHPWMPYLDEEHQEPWMDAFRMLTRESGPVAREIMLKKTFAAEEGNESGEHNVWLLVTGFSDIEKDGRVNFIDFWVTDISAQKMAARVLTDKMDEAIRLKTHQERFIDMISHEIRNPLSAVLHCGEEVVEAMHKSLAETRRLSLSHADGPPADGGHTKLRTHMSSALEAANTIMYCVQHQKQIVDDVLTLSKLDAELLVVSPIPVQPIALIRSALKIFEPELKITDTKLKITEDESLNRLAVRFILLDPNRFLQVVINLVTNAIKFTKTSEVRDIEITISAVSEAPPGERLGVEYVPRRYSESKAVSPINGPGEGHGRFDVPDDMVYLCFSVTDTGKGLTPAERSLLFNRFSQASPKTHIEYGGSGLGLFISRQITEMLGGQIGMSSTAGSGSKFAFFVKTPKVAAPRRHSVTVEPIVQMTRTLGLTTAAAPLVVAPDRKARDANPIDLKLVIPGSAEPKKRAVLVVEDNLVNQKVLCKLLRSRGFTVEAANHGEEALQLLGCPKQPDGTQDTSLYGKFEVILCDIEMPVMNGIAFVQELRKLEESEVVWGHKPVIGVTANVRGKQVTAAIEAGMDGVTTKPYRIEELIAHIDRVCYAILDR